MNILITGSQCSGKSVLAIKFASRFNEKGYLVCVYDNVRDVDRGLLKALMPCQVNGTNHSIVVTQIREGVSLSLLDMIDIKLCMSDDYKFKVDRLRAIDREKDYKKLEKLLC
jgi:AAA+ ATPase superfamily predicted ATPase